MTSQPPPQDPAHEAAHVLRETAREAVSSAPKAAQVTAERVARRWFSRSVLASSGVSIVIAVCALLLGVAVSGRQSATDASVTALRQLAQQGYDAGQRANAQLAARGQQPVPIPQPGHADDTDVLVAAATARVLASLPDQRPTAADLGHAVATYFAAHPITPAGPTPTQLAAALAGYFATNPPPSGPPGKPGQPGVNGTNGQDGHSPTEAEIQADFADYLASHPDALCPNGGQFTLVSGLIASDGTTYSGWLCVTAATPPVSTTSTPPPTTTTQEPPSSSSPPALLRIPTGLIGHHP